MSDRGSEPGSIFPSTELMPGRVWLAGAGDAARLPAATQAAIHQADFIVFDPGLAGEVLRGLPATSVAEPAPCLEMEGAEAGVTVAAADRAIELARAGWRVVRLMAEDPAASTAATRETRRLAEAHVPFRVVGGGAERVMPAASAIPMGAERPHPLAFSMTGIAG